MADYKKLATEARREVLTMIHRAQTSHIASNFSVIDIATVLYENLKPEDRVVWSAGWKAATIYYFLWKQGKITREQLESFPNPPMLGLAEPTVPGVEVSGGAMAHGQSVAVGVALGMKRAGKPGNVYCIMSDGEWQEGPVWEAAMIAGQHGLNNLTFITDANKWCAMGKVTDVADIEPAEDKWRAFKWETVRINGHDYQQIEEALRICSNRPVMVVADTVKGKGCSIMEDHLLYHYKYVDEKEFNFCLNEISKRS